MKHCVCLFIIWLISVPSFAQSKKIVLDNRVPIASQLRQGGSVFVIEQVIDLGGQNVILPRNSIFYFVGGKFRNGTLTIDTRTSFIDADYPIFENVKLVPGSEVKAGNPSRLSEIKAIWFGVIGDGKTDDTKALQNAIDAGHGLRIPVVLPRGVFKTTSALILRYGDIIQGVSSAFVNPANQVVHSIIRYSGIKGSIIVGEGSYLNISNLMLVGERPYQNHGIELKQKASFLSINNVFISNCNYALTCELDEGMGFTQSRIDNLRILNCVRGISVDCNKKSGQFITYNTFRNLYVSGIKEKGIYLCAKSINSQSFYDCNLEGVGWNDAYDVAYRKSYIATIDVDNVAKQGSVNFIGGYIEGAFYSKDGSLDSNFDYSNNAVFRIKNISITIIGTRFAQSRTIVDSQGNDCITIINCIDNGFSAKAKKPCAICRTNANTVLSIEGYSFMNQNKELIEPSIATEVAKKVSASGLRNVNQTIASEVHYTSNMSIVKFSRGPITTRPSSLTTYDAGSMFEDEKSGIVYLWNGYRWLRLEAK